MIGMNRSWFILIGLGIVTTSLVILFAQPATSEEQKTQLLSESVALTDQLSTQQRLSQMLSESISIDDQIKLEKGD